MTGTESPLSASGAYPALVPTFSAYTSSAGAAVRLAWRVVAIAFATLLALVSGGPVAYHWYVNSAIEPRPAQLTSIDGVVFLRKSSAREWSVAAPDAEIAPGDTLRTAASARGFLQLFDQSTVLLYPGSTLRVLRAEQGRFRPERTAVVLELVQGQARIGVAPPAGDAKETFFQVRTPEAQIHLLEGSYTLDAAKEGAQARVRIGEATAYTAQGSALARAGQRLIARRDRPPLGAQPMRADLLENGWFTTKSEGRLDGWVAIDLSEQEPFGTWSLAEIPGAVSFKRSGRGHGETLIAQQPDVDLWDYEKLTLSADLRIFSHSLSGGGWLGTEYPIMLQVTYRDATGGVHPWYRGFYLHNEEQYPTSQGVKIPAGDWYHVEVDLLAQVPRPWRIQRVAVVASGWDYASAVREVHLWAE